MRIFTLKIHGALTPILQIGSPENFLQFHKRLSTQHGLQKFLAPLECYLDSATATSHDFDCHLLLSMRSNVALLRVPWKALIPVVMGHFDSPSGGQAKFPQPRKGEAGRGEGVGGRIFVTNQHLENGLKEDTHSTLGRRGVIHLKGVQGLDWQLFPGRKRISRPIHPILVHAHICRASRLNRS